MTLIALLYVVVSALIAAVVAMWKVFAKRSDKCEKDRDVLRAEQLKITRRVAAFESCATPNCGALSALQRHHTFSLHPEKDAPPK